MLSGKRTGRAARLCMKVLNTEMEVTDRVTCTMVNKMHHIHIMINFNFEKSGGRDCVHSILILNNSESNFINCKFYIL